VLRLGEYLLKIKVFDFQRRKSIKLDKENDVFIVRLVVKDTFLNKKRFLELVKQTIPALSKNVFDGKETVIHLTDDRLKTLKIIK
jgi:hypothetical protein